MSVLSFFNPRPGSDPDEQFSVPSASPRENGFPLPAPPLNPGTDLPCRPWRRRWGARRAGSGSCRRGRRGRLADPCSSAGIRRAPRRMKPNSAAHYSRCLFYLVSPKEECAQYAFFRNPLLQHQSPCYPAAWTGRLQVGQDKYLADLMTGESGKL